MNALLFIPDISGFTDFVTSTEIEHSRHIVSELLELLIDADSLTMEVAEIEGDAILFYRLGNPPSVRELAEQARAMFLRFHAQLKLYESRRICQCGACTTASTLSLKMIAHAGPIEMIRVKDFRKPHGADLIVAHRLLKNDVDSNEYLLLTETVCGSTDVPEHSDLGPFHKSSMSYDDIGTVPFNYVSLDGLRKLVPEPDAIPPFRLTSNPVVIETRFDRPLATSYEFISNLAYRMTFTEGLDDLQYTPDRVNRVGTKHQCLVNGKPIGFDTIAADFGAGNLVYGERPERIPLVQDAAFFWILNGDDTTTNVRVEIHYHPGRGIKRLLSPLFRLGSARSLRSILTKAKQVAERELPEALVS